MLMLDNSVRSLSPPQKRKLYISCVLPLMTYGCQVWYTARSKTRMAPLRTAHNDAMRWITGGFRTSPAGALEAFGGVMPIRLYVRKLQERYFLRIRTLMASHPLAALFPTRLGPSDGAPFIRFTAELPKPADTLPLSHAPEHFGIVTESFDPLHPECHPGRRLVDTHGDRIKFLLEHPKKRSAELDTWIANVLLPRIQACRDDPDTLYLFTDGSAFPMLAKSAAGYHAYHGSVRICQNLLPLWARSMERRW